MLKSVFIFLLPSFAIAAQPCKIEIVDKENGWPVPLVELQTTHDIRLVSDNSGLIAVDEPELLDREVWFTVKGHGYGLPKDGFGFEGIRATLKPGGTFRIELQRRNIAKRIGRLTGGGLFAEATKLGQTSPLPESGVFGCDSVLMTRHGNKLFWLWGDTTIPNYPLGIFQTTAAFTPLAPLKEAKPPLALPFDLFRNSEKKPRGVANLPGDGPTWLTGLVSFGDRVGATYSKIQGHVEEYEVGLCLWDDKTSNFTVEKVLWKKGDGPMPLLPKGHPSRWKDESGKSWVLLGDPFPILKYPDNFDAWKDPSTWEKPPAPPAPKTPDDKEVRAHRGSIAWNAPLNRWITVFTEQYGKPSPLGEIWYAESDSPFGPWKNAVKILTHDNYTFYNPVIQTELTGEKSPYILFEGTYTAEFADHARPTPRYNYNQILYRLDLDSPGLKH